ncbi:MAG: redox-regulated ATPase YchF [Candidatus Nanoarchaeia archaeon]
MIIGLVGKPNCGKSTFFKAATLADVEIANYPFTTIEKNEGVGFVSVDCVDNFFNVQCSPKFGYCVKHKRFVPVQLIDVAGLVPDAHLGKGRGNQFLDDLRQADVLIHIVDISGSVNEHGEPVEPLSYDPANDISFLEVELDMWYFQIIKKGWERFSRQIVQERTDVVKALAKQLSGLKVTEEHVLTAFRELNLPMDVLALKDDHLKALASELRQVTKPMVIAANKIDIPGSDKNLERLIKLFPKYRIIPCSADFELALKEAAKNKLIQYIPGSANFTILNESNLTPKQKEALKFIQGLLDKYGSTGIQNVLNYAVFELLNYIAIFPVANSHLTDKDNRILPDCYLVPKDTTALDFAFRVHTDIGSNFVRAIDLKTKKVVGKDHKLQHMDVVEIVSSK